jgi:hypothetical protein
MMLQKRIPMILLGSILILSFGLSSCRPADTPQPTEAQEPEVEATEPVTSEDSDEPQPIILRVGGVKDIDCWNLFSCSQIWDF